VLTQVIATTRPTHGSAATDASQPMYEPLIRIADEAMGDLIEIVR
jgi:hypothetical protein